MTVKRVVYNDPDDGGKFKIICPSPRAVAERMAQGMTEIEAVNQIADKSIPENATNRNMVNLRDIPPRTNPVKTLNRRDAFEWDSAAEKVIVNPNKIKPL